MNRQTGFTLVEVLAASISASILVLAIFAVYVQSNQVMESIAAQLRLNQEARIMMQILANGDPAGGANNRGYRGAFADGGGIGAIPDIFTISATAGELNALQRNATAVSSTFGDVDVECRSAVFEVEGCVIAGQLITRNGYVDTFEDAEVELNNRQGISDYCGASNGENERVAYVGFRLVEPHRAADQRSTALEFSQTYSGIFYLHQEETAGNGPC